jgi:hypothetical protein
VRWFEHTSIADLQRVLESLADVFRAQRQRVFVVIEGLSSRSGKLFPLDAVMRLKDRFPFRLVLDDSLGIGVLGPSGRGTCEHFKIDPRQVEIIIFSLGHAIGSVGGMACASAMLCNHMRLNCTGYVFSCSSPPYVAQAAIMALDLIDEGLELTELRRAVNTVHSHLAQLSPRLVCDSDRSSPFLHLHLGPRYATGVSHDDRQVIAAIAEVALGVHHNAEALKEDLAATGAAPRTTSRTPSKGGKGAQQQQKDVTTTNAKTATVKRSRRASGGGGGGSSKSIELLTALPNSPVLIGVAQFAPQERFPPLPTLRVAVNALLDDASLQSALDTLDKAARTVLK